MTRSRRILLTTIGAMVVIVGGWTLMIGTFVVWSGVSTVQIQPAEGRGFAFPVPMAAIEMVAWTAPKFVHSEIDEITIDADLGELKPAVLALADGISDLSDGTIVEIESDSETVRVWQEKGRLKIEVDADDVQIRIGVPSRSIARTLKHLAQGFDT